LFESRRMIRGAWRDMMEMYLKHERTKRDSWRDMSVEDLMRLLKEEVRELEESREKDEALDVMLIAAMIAARAEDILNAPGEGL